MSDETLIQEAGIRKAAILVACLDPAVAEVMLSQLTPDQTRQVREAVALLDEIDADERQRIIDEFLRLGHMVPDASPSGIELDAPLIERQISVSPWDAGSADAHGRHPRLSETRANAHPITLPESSKNADATADDGPPFGFLSEADDEKLAHLLQDERPPTVALVLAHLPSQQAGGVLAHFPPNLQVEIIRRLVDLDEADTEVLHEVERALETRLLRQFAVQRRRVAGLEAVAAILDASDDRISGMLLDNLAACDRPLAEKLGLKTITFDDLDSLQDDAIAAVFRAADPALAQTALIGASPPLVERLLRTMAPREAKRWRKQLDDPGPLRLSDVYDARRQIAALAQRMLKKSTKPASAA
jgi:flagellar motor switch protein FliG